MIRATISATIVVATAISAGPALADRLDEIKARGVLVCGTVPNYEPFSYPDPSTRQLVGYDMDFCEAIAKKLDVKTEIKTSSYDGRIPELNEGRVDILTADLGYTPTRAEQINYSYQYFVVPHRIIVRADKAYNSLGDMAEKRISTIRGSTTEAFVKNSVTNPTLVSFDDAPTAFLALIQGKVDGFSASTLVGVRLMAKSAEGPPSKMIEQPVGLEFWGIGVKKGEDRLLQTINTALTDMDRDGEAESIFNKWLGPDTPFKQKKNFKIGPIAN